MGETRIEYVDRTWNPVKGCKPISPGCRNCYAAQVAGTRLKRRPQYAGLTCRTSDGRFEFNGKVFVDRRKFDEPLRVRRPARFLVPSMGDLFCSAKAPGGKFASHVDEIFLIMAEAGRHLFLLLTKRASTMLAYHNSRQKRGLGWPANVWPGVSVENQEEYRMRAPHLEDMTDAVRTWISYEPALGPLDLDDFPKRTIRGHEPGLIVAGGETGYRARPAHPQWIRDLRDQCGKRSVPFFFKGWGSNIPTAYPEAELGKLASKFCLVTPEGKVHGWDKDEDLVRHLDGDEDCAAVGFVRKKTIRKYLLDGKIVQEFPRRKVRYV